MIDLGNAGHLHLSIWVRCHNKLVMAVRKILEDGTKLVPETVTNLCGAKRWANTEIDIRKIEELDKKFVINVLNADISENMDDLVNGSGR